MSDRYVVLWSESAVRDVEEIVSFIAANSTPEAERVRARLEEAARSLGTSPTRGRVVPEIARFGLRSRREIIVRPYRVVYRVAKRNVLVLAVLDGRRDLEDVLLERILRSVEPESDLDSEI